jgi:hypothetical protein
VMVVVVVLMLMFRRSLEVLLIDIERLVIL